MYSQNAVPIPNIQTLTVEDGLSQSVVYSIAQDSKGFIWMATFNGLDRYDGYNFLHFRYQPADSFSLSSNEVSTIYEDTRRRLWVGTFNNGLNYFDPFYRRFYHFFPGTRVCGIAEDAAGNLYINFGNAIIRMPVSWQNGDKESAHSITGTSAFTPPSALPGFPANAVSLYADSHKNLFVTTREGLFSLAFDTARRVFSFIKLFNYSIPAGADLPQWLEDRRRSRYYLLTGQGVFESDNTGFRNAVKVHAGIAYYNNTFIDDSSRLWYTAHETNFLFNLKTQKETEWASGIRYPGYDFGHLTVRLQDAGGTIWLSTSGKGILTWSEAQDRFHSLLPGTYTGTITAVGSASFLANNQWLVHLGEQTNDMRRLTGKDFRKYSYLRFPQDSKGICWRVSRDNTHIIGFHPVKGITRFSRLPQLTSNQLQNNQPVTGFQPAKNWVYLSANPGYLFMDREDNIWLYATGELIYYDIRNNAYHFLPIHHLSGDDNFTKRMYEDVSGTIWISIIGGICAYSKKTGAIRFYLWKPDGGNGSLADASVTSFCDDPTDPQHILWVGTRNGISRMNKATGLCRNFTGDNGLPNNVVYNILPDNRANLWLSTNNGLCCLATGSFTIRNFNAVDGLQGSEFNGGAALKLPNGTLVFGGTNGVSYFNPSVIKSPPAPQVVLTDWKLFGKSQNMSGAASGVDIAYVNAISIMYACNNLSFSFAGTGYSRRHSLQYRYRLMPFDKAWNYTGAALHEATYTNLDPGDYTFEVEAANPGGSWGKKSNALQVHVLPLWWQTWWFRLSGVVTGALAVYCFHRYRLRQALKIQQVRNNIARDLHDEIGSTLSTISIYSAIAQQQNEKPGSDPFVLIGKISENATQVLEAMNDIVWSINTRNDTFENIFVRMREYTAQLLELKGYTLHFHFNEGLEHKSFGLERRKNFYLVFKEALNNIAKYAGGNNVWITVTDQHSRLVLNIRDDGRGFDTSIKRSGNGLINMQNRAYSLGGNLTVASQPGMGTEIILSIPYR